MNVFRGLLILFTVGIVAYTGIVIVNHGPNLIPVFIGNLTALTWSGQFNFDFACYLMLSGLWAAWRHEFSVGGIVLGLLASVLGILLFAPYLLWASHQADGDMRKLLLGDRA